MGRRRLDGIGVLSETRDEDDAASYRVQSSIETFHDDKHDLRCLVVHSSSLNGRTERRIDNQLDTDEKDLKDTVGRLTDRSFACKPDAKDALKKRLDDHNHPCFEIDAEIVETEEKRVVTAQVAHRRTGIVIRRSLICSNEYPASRRDLFVSKSVCRQRVPDESEPSTHVYR